MTKLTNRMTLLAVILLLSQVTSLQAGLNLSLRFSGRFESNNKNNYKKYKQHLLFSGL